MRGIERLATGALLALAVTGTAVFARTSAPGGTHLQAVRLQSPPRSHAVAPLPVVAAVPATPPHRVSSRPATPAPAHAAPAPAAGPARTAALASPATPPVPAPARPAAPDPAPTPTPSPSPAPAPEPAPPTRTVAAAHPVATATKAFGHSHPRGHAWGHVKHAVTQPAAEAAPAPAAPQTTGDEPSADAGNGNGHAWGRSKHANDD